MFWKDKWQSNLLQDQFPRLFSYAMNGNISVREMLLEEDRTQFFHLPMSPQAFQELQVLEGVISQVHLDPDVHDVWNTVWKDGIYTSSRYYQIFFKDMTASKIFNCIWSCKVMLRIKVFAWLLVSDRLNTGSIYFLAAISAFGYGITYRWNGNLETLLNRFSSGLVQSLTSPFLLRWLYLLLGTYGNNEMKLYFRKFSPLLGVGGGGLYMRSPCMCIG